jgi:hypothetical protein
VIDDKKEDGGPILEALSKIGVGAAYFNGSIDQVPDEPLRGVRLLATDLNLQELDVSDTTALLAPLLAVLERVIADDNGPLLVIVWTRHGEVVDDFTALLHDRRPGLHPHLIVALDKSEFYEEVGAGRVFNIKRLAEVLAEKLASWFPIDVVMDWEQRVHDAASGTTCALTNLLDRTGWRDEMKWREELQTLLAALAVAEGGAQLSSGRLVIRGLHGGLNPLHADRLDASTTELDEIESQAARLLDGVAPLSPEQRAALNRSLLLAERDPGIELARPGSIYLEAQWKGSTGRDRFPIGDKADAPRHDLLANLLELPEAKREQLLGLDWKIGLLELTPACDFSQDKAPIGRLLPVLFIPSDVLGKAGEKCLLKSPAVKRIGPVLLKPEDGIGVEGVCSLAISSRFVFGVSPHRLRKQAAALRLRQEVLTDVQAWFAAQAARPGFRSVE